MEGGGEGTAAIGSTEHSKVTSSAQDQNQTLDHTASLPVSLLYVHICISLVSILIGGIPFHKMCSSKRKRERERS
jgi:hypothetical protein